MFNLQRSLAALFAAAVLLVAAIAAGALFNAQEARELSVLAQDSRERLLLLEQVVRNLFEAESSQRAFAASGDEIFLEEHTLQRNDLALRLRTLEETGLIADQSAPRLHRLRELILDRLDIMDRLIAARREEGMEAAIAVVASQAGKRIMDRIREVTRQLAGEELARIEQRRAQLDDRSRLTFYLLVGGTLLNMGLLAGAFAAVRHESRRSRDLFKRLQDGHEEMTRINELNSALQSCASRDDATELLRHYMMLLFPGMTGALYLMRASRNQLQLAARWGEEPGEPLDPIDRDDCWALRLGRTHLIPQDQRALRCKHPHRDAGAYLCVPMNAQGETAGMLHLNTDDPAPLEQARARAERLAIHTGPSLSGILLREALRQQNIRDPLTNLYNRRYLEEIVPREVMRARRNGSNVGAVMIDVDHFKLYNDKHGHAAGDVVLSEFARYLQLGVRGEDIACRYGGEEFLLVLPGASAEQCRTRADALRDGVATLSLKLHGERLPEITASFGVASFPEHGEEWEAVLNRADSALYEAKRAGRNRVVGAGERTDEQAVAASGGT